ncbi:MAG: hypothetical protein KKC43_17485 [Alphaproteobacteria bacterium]|nr:hypothetical protein [Alphaproteobacteria bacterium]
MNTQTTTPHRDAVTLIQSQTPSPHHKTEDPNRSSVGADARFWDKVADGYFAKPIKDLPSYEIKLAATRQHLRADMDILEFGCGSGSTAIAHAPYEVVLFSYTVFRPC